LFNNISNFGLGNTGHAPLRYFWKLAHGNPPLNF
jgi:hypothetical protein